jgi:hypothetical protein
MTKQHTLTTLIINKDLTLASGDVNMIRPIMVKVTYFDRIPNFWYIFILKLYLTCSDHF